MRTEVQAMSLAIQADVPTLVTGGSGTGKTSAADMIGRILGFHCPECDTGAEVVIGSIRDQTEFGGLPMMQGDHFTLAPALWVRHCVEHKKLLVVFDEMNTSPPAVFGAMLTVLTSRKSGDTILPKETRCLGLMNPIEIAAAAGGTDLAPALANRFCHLTWDMSLKEYESGMINGWEQLFDLPKLNEASYKACVTEARNLVTAFLKTRPMHLFALPKDESARSGAWPSHRSWEMAMKCWAAAKATADQLGEDYFGVSYMLTTGCVGNAVGKEFLTYVKALDLPDPELLLKDPKSFNPPKEGDKLFAVLNSVASAAVGNLTKPRWFAAWDLIKMAGEQRGSDTIIVAAKTLVQARKPELPVPTAQLGPIVQVLQKAKLLGK